MYETLAEKRATLQANLENANQKRAEEHKKIRVLANSIAILRDEQLADLLISGDRQAQSIVNAAGPSLTDINMDGKFLEGAIHFAMENGMGTLLNDITDSTAEELPSSICKLISTIRLPDKIPDNNAKKGMVKK